MAHISSEDIRHYILDRTIQDNELDMDLYFSDEEIATAMKHAARDFNAIPPMVCTVSPTALSGDTNMFFDGILKHLYIMVVSKLKRNELEYTAGNVVTSINASQIKHLTELIKIHNEFFQKAATDYKLLVNLRHAYRAF